MKKLLVLAMVGVMSMFALTACGQNNAAATDAATAAAVDTAVDAAVDEAVDEAVGEAVAEEVAEEVVADAAEGITYVDGYYANDGNGNDFMIAFYEGDAGDLAYVNDGTNEVVAEYTVENATMDDGTEFLLVTVGNAELGYFQGEDGVYIVDNEGNIYAAGTLSEEEADTLYQAVVQ
ncbi:MAG: hypothetical protein IJJ13_10275 [Lachnospiraceae bacterium]|nr:hypothetical protein [Lachnospiraceae bacterium]